MKKIAEALNSISEYSLDQPNTLNIVSADPLQKFQPIAQETAINTLPTVSTTPDTNDPKNIVIEPIESGYSKEKDWRKKSMVTKVKDQGNCGSSATFATIALCESVLMLTGKAFTKAVY